MTTTPILDGPRVAPASGRDPRSIVILTHGYGSNGADLIGLVPYWRQALPDTLFVSPNAPFPCPGAPGGYQWWSLEGADRAAGVRSAAPILDAFIEAELTGCGLTDEHLALVGFSQGTMLALHVGLRRKRPVGGIVGYSGALLDEGALAAEIRSRPPVLLVHGAADPMVPVAAFYKAHEALDRLGLDVATHVSPGLGHSIDSDGLTLGEQFLARVLG
jgi:phospholipase/carboxylesterase